MCSRGGCCPQLRKKIRLGARPKSTENREMEAAPAEPIGLSLIPRSYSHLRYPGAATCRIRNLQSRLIATPHRIHTVPPCWDPILTTQASVGAILTEGMTLELHECLTSLEVIRHVGISAFGFFDIAAT